MEKGTHYNNAKAVVAFFIIALGFGLFLLFYNYQDSIVQSNSFYPFITLVVIIMGFLLGLLYLVNNQSKPKRAVSKIVKKTKKKSR